MLLKVVQSVLERKPFCEPLACCMERFAVEVFQLSGDVADIEVVPKVEPAAVEVRVVPIRLRPVPMIKEFTGATPLPIRMPDSVLDPVPPPVGKRVVACAAAGSSSATKRAIVARSFLNINILEKIISK